jgi:hypothetical protein
MRSISPPKKRKGSDRELLGSDVVGGSSTAAKTIRQFDPLLDVLKPKTRQLVARENFANLMKRMAKLRRTAKLNDDGSHGIVLPVDYRYLEYADMPRSRMMSRSCARGSNETTNSSIAIDVQRANICKASCAERRNALNPSEQMADLRKACWPVATCACAVYNRTNTTFFSHPAI